MGDDGIDYTALWDVLTRHSALGQHSLHGPRHWRNVEANGLMLAERTEADVTVVRLFAVFHDAERRSEGHDPLHGEHAAELVRRMHGELFALDDAQLELLCDACEFHHHGLTSSHVTIGACWDADRLDLPRVGIVPERELLSTEAAREFLLSAKFRCR